MTFGQMAGAVLGWIIVTSALGWLAWPLAFRLLPGLPDRGYAVSRTLGLLLAGYVYWLLGVLGFLQNTIGAALLAVLAVLGLATWVSARHPDRARRGEWFAAHRGYVLTTEVLFLLAFVGWAVVRAYMPEATGTEKPMELAFLNAVRRSPALPPNDPWLSGYAISYYYFGYVLMSFVSMLAGTAMSVAFNLGGALLVALTLVGSYGLVYNLLAARRREIAPGEPLPGGVARGALLGPLLVGLMGNLGGALELLQAASPRFPGAGFWRWLDIPDLTGAAAQMPPTAWRHWWWWRASRVIFDRDAAGVPTGLQPIDEFPAFSYVLGDMHPHVLALPFVLLALALALNLLLERPGAQQRFAPVQVGLYVVVFGGLAFLNTWDLPIYLFVLIGALAIRQMRDRGFFTLDGLLPPLAKGVSIALMGAAAYLPWYLSFSSQAGGILPNAIFATRLHQFFVMFGPLLVVVGWFAVDEALRRRRTGWLNGIGIALAVLAGLIALAALLSVVALRAEPAVASFVVSSAGFETEGVAADAIQARLPEAIRIVLAHRLAHPLTPLALTALLAFALAALLTAPPADPLPEPPPAPQLAANSFVLLLIVTGALLTLAPEFVYLRDNFGQRLNTIFKFYYAAWLLWAIAAAAGGNILLARLRAPAKATFALVAGLLVLGGSVYLPLAVSHRIHGTVQGGGTPTLDASAYLERYAPDDAAGIEWLRANAPQGAVVLEAVGGAYSSYGRVSAMSGIPTVMGWPNHERQWRGPTYAGTAGTREQDVRTIYQTPSIEIAQNLLNRYGVTYIFVGSLERDPSFAPPEGLEKFARAYTPVFQAGNTVIYRTDIPRVEAQP